MNSIGIKIKSTPSIFPPNPFKPLIYIHHPPHNPSLFITSQLAIYLKKMIMKNSSRINYCLVFFLSICLLFIYRINGQISTPCTASMITSFTPCLNFITGSTANGQSSPTQDCCDSVKSMVADSVDCGCLILTGNVPLSLPFNRTLAISLPQICNGGVPLRCKCT